MKHNLLLLAMLTMAVTFAACSDDDDETCEKDEFCEATITVCCTSETDCKYNVDGTDYDTIEEATDNLECTAGIAPDGDKSRVMESLKALTASAKANL